MKIKSPYHILASTFTFLLLLPSYMSAQLPTNIDPGQDEDPVSIYQQPEYIIPIVGLFVLLIGLYFWQKRKKK